MIGKEVSKREDFVPPVESDVNTVQSSIGIDTRGNDPPYESELIIQRYERRKQLNESSIYDPHNPAVYLTLQERDRAIVRWITSCGIAPLGEKRLIEIGCGSGANLLRFLTLGFRPENLVANELIEERAEAARRVLPGAIDVIHGDATELDLENESFDVVFQATVFTSILDDTFQQRLAERMWRLVRPGGGVLWYDFIYNNPKNPDVRGVPVERVRELFPNGQLRTWKLTLAPPISRRVTRISPALYSLFNKLPFLRSHVLCWIEKL